MGVNAYALAVMGCRKILMAIAVQEGAKEGENYLFYVDHIAEMGLVPPRAKGMLDKVRKLGNAENHKIAMATQEEAVELLQFLEMILKINYEYATDEPKGDGSETGGEGT
ncbi:MAG: hypothetical protein CMH76_03280 [Nitrospinae bacterium]|nr:hypothetical protein [Nitrospinota bacterium]